MQQEEGADDGDDASFTTNKNASIHSPLSRVVCLCGGL
jgi:hypothetical protein